MADNAQRTEKATPQHRKKMREKGMVARSTELGGWGSLLLVTSILPWLGELATARVTAFTQTTVELMGHPSVSGATALFGSGLETAALTAMPTVVIGGALAVALAVAQVGIRFTPKALRLEVGRISPRAGLKRVFSPQGVWTLGKTVIKMGLLALVGYLVLHRLIGGVLGAQTLVLQSTIAVAAANVEELLRIMGGLALLLAAGDYFFQRRTHNAKLRMTKQEVRDERRQSDGSPQMRRALRSRARRISRRHLMAAVANADVVVTNPTHFAVAIAYDRTKDRAPRVVAKGADMLARSIREHARANGVVVVENPLLARTLYGACEIDDITPPHLYTAVARLLAFVYSLSSTARVFNDVHVMAS
ncbi:MAG: EscU/YscU/HrcU family type III secretion system export apparatus switch protein [Acidimicrobiales bacterium]